MANSITKISVIALVTAFVVYQSYSKSDTQVNSKDLNSKTEKSSVSIVNGKYKIDTLAIMSDRNKKALIASIETQSLSVRNKMEEVPDFIRAFLDSICADKKFDIVNPGEDWKSGIVDFGHQVMTKVYDVTKKDSVLMLSGDGAVLPNKQLVYFGIGKDVALLSYYRGGFGPLPNVIMIKFSGKTILDFWYGSVYENSTHIATKSDILKNLKSKRTGGC